MDYRELETERLLLRRPAPGDAAQVFASYGADPIATRFLTWPPQRTIGDAEEGLAGRIERLATGVEASWMIAVRPRTEVCGVISAWAGDASMEIGFVLARNLWGRGYTTEAARAVVAWCFEQPGVQRVWATCDHENPASARVLEKAGMQPGGRFARDIVRPNLGPEPRPTLLYEVERASARPV